MIYLETISKISQKNLGLDKGAAEIKTDVESVQRVKGYLMTPLIDNVIHYSLKPVQPLILHSKNHLWKILFIRGTGDATPDHAVTRDTERTAEPKENGVIPVTR